MVRIALATLLVVAPAAAADIHVARFDWTAHTIPEGARAAEGPGGTHGILVRGADVPVTRRLLVIEAPGVGAPAYVLRGRLRHRGIGGSGHLEMWSVFADGQRYFTRTLAPSGPLRSLHGDSDWRGFEVPFTLDDGPAPVRLELNAVLPEGGALWLGPLELVQLDAPWTPGDADAWWSDATGGWIGGLLGSAVGVLGALIGTLAGLGRGRGFCLGLLRLLAVAGALLLGFGLVALVFAQPFAVWYPFLLVGGLCAALGAATFGSVRRAYDAHERRRVTGAPGVLDT